MFDFNPIRLKKTLFPIFTLQGGRGSGEISKYFIFCVEISKMPFHLVYYIENNFFNLN